MAARKPRNIDKSIWDSMSDMQKASYLRTEGDKETAKMLGRMVGRESYASKAKSRQSEAKGVASKAKGVAEKAKDPKFRAQKGGKAVINYNKKKNTAYRQAGRRVMPDASKKELRSLAEDIARILKKMK
jgi:hypothetical protein